jgi:hypothetical protein
MRKWFTSLFLVAAMLGGVFGAGAHQGEGSCPLSNLPDCCKKAHSSSNATEVSMARLCCNLNCSEPGSGGGSASSSFSLQQVAAPLSVVIPQPFVFDYVALKRSNQTSSLTDFHPKYIQHLALLI